jgi:hypothetical protein
VSFTRLGHLQASMTRWHRRRRRIPQRIEPATVELLEARWDETEEWEEVEEDCDE